MADKFFKLYNRTFERKPVLCTFVHNLLTDISIAFQSHSTLNWKNIPFNVKLFGGTKKGRKVEKPPNQSRFLKTPDYGETSRLFELTPYYGAILNSPTEQIIVALEHYNIRQLI